MLSGTSPDGPTVDKAVLIAKQFGPDVINSVQVLSPQQVMLEVRFVEATRQAGRDLGVQWNVFGKRNLANIGNRTPSDQLPVTNSNPNRRQPLLAAGRAGRRPQRRNVGARHLAGGRGRRAVGHRAVRRDGQQAARRPASRPTSSSMRSSRRASPARWPSRTSWRCRATPRASSPAANIRSRCPARSAPSPSTTSATASASPSRRRC